MEQVFNYRSEISSDDHWNDILIAVQTYLVQHENIKEDRERGAIIFPHFYIIYTY